MPRYAHSDGAQAGRLEPHGGKGRSQSFGEQAVFRSSQRVIAPSATVASDHGIGRAPQRRLSRGIIHLRSRSVPVHTGTHTSGMFRVLSWGTSRCASPARQGQSQTPNRGPRCTGRGRLDRGLGEPRVDHASRGEVDTASSGTRVVKQLSLSRPQHRPGSCGDQRPVPPRVDVSVYTPCHEFV